MKSRIREFLVSNFLYGEDDEDLTEEDSFLEKQLVDSTGILELVAFVEESFAIKIKDSEVVPENLDSIAALSEFITRKSSSG